MILVFRFLIFWVLGLMIEKIVKMMEEDGDDEFSGFSFYFS